MKDFAETIHHDLPWSDNNRCNTFCTTYAQHHQIVAEWTPKHEYKAMCDIIENKEDGDCYWRALQDLFHEPATTIKQQVLRQGADAGPPNIMNYLAWLRPDKAWADTATVLDMYALKTNMVVPHAWWTLAFQHHWLRNHSSPMATRSPLRGGQVDHRAETLAVPFWAGAKSEVAYQ